MTIALELKQLKKTYPGGVQALRGIDLQVEPVFLVEKALSPVGV